MKFPQKRIIIIAILLMLFIGSFKISNAEKINMAYLYGNYDYISLVNRNQDALNVVSPSYFDLDARGNLVLNYLDKNFVNEMHKNEIKVTPFLSNHWDKEKGRAALSNKEKLSSDLVKVIKDYNLDGVNVDIENVTEVDRKNYIEFVRLLREKLPKEKIVSVAVAANPYNLKTGWHGSYDYEELAKNSDYLMIMAYDEHYESGPQGAVASINFIEESIKYALNKIDKEKIVIGIPFYGRYWQNGKEYGGYGVTLDKINNLIFNYESEVTYDKKTETAKAIIKIKAGDLKPSISGRTLYEGTYTFYYENRESINAKIDLANKYDLKGIGCWSLGQETEEIWISYSNYLRNDNKSFCDIENVSWAKNAIEFVKQKQWIIGRKSNYYMPQEYLTRAEFATIISRILNLETQYSTETLFYDVNRHWAQNSINALGKTGIIEGYEDKSFRPDEKITRAEVAKILTLIGENLKETDQKIDFYDVKNGDWSYEYIIKMAKCGIVKGYVDGTYKPQKSITRAEIAVALERMYN